MRSLALSVLPLLACASGARLSNYTECASDAECGSNQVCFASGCGDPGSNIVVEVTGDAVSLHSQEIAITTLSPSLVLDVQGPLKITGGLRQDSADHNGTTDFPGSMTVTARGESLLIPGVSRTYSLVLPKIDHGLYELAVGAGKYSVTAKPGDPGIPYQTLRGVTVAPGEDNGGATFTFPSVSETLFLSGTLVVRVEPGRPEKVVYQAGMSIQAFDPASGTPLSQVATVSSTGVFVLALDYSAEQLPSIVLVATPYDNTALAPTKTFVLSPVPTTAIGRLELGDFGSGLPQVPGRLISASGAPIANASVTLEGKVGGGGSFKSRTVTTNADGAFTVDLLPSPAEAAYTLTAIPPPESTSGIVETQVHAGLVGGAPAFTASADATIAKTDFTCPDRLIMHGTVTNPMGTPAGSVQVIATAVEAIDGRALPTRSTAARTDDSGAYTLVLDPAKYRIDYLPTQQLPRKTRLVRVDQTVDVDAGTLLSTLDLGNFELSYGRTVSGTVTVRPNRSAEGTGVPAPNALVRFYRVTSVEGTSSSLLIGESIADEAGGYSVVLPDHPSATAAP